MKAKFLLCAIAALFSSLVFADAAAVVATVDTGPSFDIVTLIVSVLGERAAYVLISIALVGYVWAQVRQVVSPEKLAKLPAWVVWLLELLAANKGRAENAIKPERYKQWLG
jgi:hypothetical protein